MQDSFNLIKGRVEEKISTKDGVKTARTRRVAWVLKRFIRYMWDALLDGNTINVMGGPTFKLKMEEARNLEEEEKRRYRQSSRKFGYMFFIDIEYKGDIQNWKFYPDEEVMKRLEEMLETDKIYQLTKS